MKNTNEEFAAELAALESQVALLETQARARGLAVPQRPDVTTAKKPSATLDEIFAAMGTMEAHAGKLRTTTRLATPLAYAPNKTPAATAGLTPTQRIAAAGGAKAMSLKSEIAKLEKLSAGFAKGSASARAVESRLTNLRPELSKLAAGK